MAVGAYDVAFLEWHIFPQFMQRIMPLTDPKRNIYKSNAYCRGVNLVLHVPVLRPCERVGTIHKTIS
jgi:hypothetical protein